MNCVNEIWKDIPGYENLYQISSLGRVKSLKRNKLLTPYRPSQKGYSQVFLGRGNMYRIHRLVAMAFIPNPDNKPCIDHINGDRLDNRVENLRWVTYSENNSTIVHKYRQSLAHTNHPKKSKPVLQVDKVTGQIIKEYPSLGEAGRSFENINNAASNISRCCRNIRPSAFGYIWRYK